MQARANQSIVTDLLSRFGGRPLVFAWGATLLLGSCADPSDDSEDSDRMHDNSGPSDPGAGPTIEANQPAQSAGAEDPLATRPAGVTLCYSELADSHPAVVHFREVFDAADFDARADAITKLAAAVQEYPKEEELAVMLGLAYLWRLQEPRSLDDTLLTLDSVTNAKEQLEHAYALCPTDHRIAGWIGPIEIILGRLIDDPTMVEAGTAILNRGVEYYPAFVIFTQVISYSDLSIDDPRFQNALESIRKLFSIPIDNSLCDSTRHDPACVNSPRAWHNIEASMLYVGDLYAKARDREAALAMYTAAMKTPSWASPNLEGWPYRDVLEERIRTIDRRVAAAITPDTGDDFESIWESDIMCTICHEK